MEIIKILVMPNIKKLKNKIYNYCVTITINKIYIYKI